MLLTDLVKVLTMRKHLVKFSNLRILDTVIHQGDNGKTFDVQFGVDVTGTGLIDSYRIANFLIMEYVESNTSVFDNLCYAALVDYANTNEVPIEIPDDIQVVSNDQVDYMVRLDESAGVLVFFVEVNACHE